MPPPTLQAAARPPPRPRPRRDRGVPRAPRVLPGLRVLRGRPALPGLRETLGRMVPAALLGRPGLRELPGPKARQERLEPRAQPASAASPTRCQKGKLRRGPGALSDP